MRLLLAAEINMPIHRLPSRFRLIRMHNRRQKRPEHHRPLPNNLRYHPKHPSRPPPRRLLLPFPLRPVLAHLLVRHLLIHRIQSLPYQLLGQIPIIIRQMPQHPLRPRLINIRRDNKPAVVQQQTRRIPQMALPLEILLRRRHKPIPNRILRHHQALHADNLGKRVAFAMQRH